jgi:hypothetical protein
MKRESDVMNRRKVTSIAVDAFYDNFTCAALFRKLRIPGSPREIIDPRPVHTFWADEFSQILADAKRRLHLIAGFAMFGSILSIFSKGNVKRRSAKEEDLKNLLADWSSYIKP